MYISYISNVYQLYQLKDNAIRVPAYYYYDAINKLRDLLVDQDPNLTTLQDDRPPTCYFKVKGEQTQISIPRSYVLFTL